ncbi:MAG: hypothetical protein COB31_07020 [Erythrobacter sp.]|nr:MAG: hypothetical protein COB31_07020 [Erythrobacter sp.]
MADSLELTPDQRQLLESFTRQMKVLCIAGAWCGDCVDQCPILWQFAPTKQFERDDFARFLDLIPDSQDGVPLRHALEIRHESFADPTFFELARTRNMAVVFADSDEYPCIDEATADFSYARLQRTEESVETGYDDKALDAWADRARGWSKGGRDAYVFFIAGAKVRNPTAARMLIKRMI